MVKASGGNESEVLSDGTRPTYQQGKPWGMRHITNGQNDTGYWSYSSQTQPMENVEIMVEV